MRSAAGFDRVGRDARSARFPPGPVRRLPFPVRRQTAFTASDRPERNLPMTQVGNGDTVKIHYSGRLRDGTVFDTSNGRDPLEFTVGERQIIADLEASVVGMAVVAVL